MEFQNLAMAHQHPPVEFQNFPVACQTRRFSAPSFSPPANNQQAGFSGSNFTRTSWNKKGERNIRNDKSERDVRNKGVKRKYDDEMGSEDNLFNRKQQQQQQPRGLIQSHGKVVRYIEKAGLPAYGFIKYEDAVDNEDIYFHSENVLSNLLELREGDEVFFKIRHMRGKGKPSAVNVTLKNLSSRSYREIEKYMTLAEAIVSQKKKSFLKKEKESIVVKRRSLVNQSSSDENESSVNTDEEMLTGEDNSAKICKDGNIVVQEKHSSSEITNKETYKNETKEPSENETEEPSENETENFCENETEEPENEIKEPFENENEENNGDDNESEPPKAKKMKSFLEESNDLKHFKAIVDARNKAKLLPDLLVTNTANKQTSNLVENANIMDVLTSPSTWRMIIKKISTFKSSFSLFERFIKLFVNLHDRACIQKNAFRKVVNCVTEEEEFFHPVTGSFKRYIDKCMKMEEFHGAMESIRRFILISGQCNPGRISVVLIFVKLLMKKKELHKEMAPILFRLLTSLTSSSIEDISHLEWKELPLTLKASEISSEDLINAINLRPVKINGCYDSPDDYIDIYFRLLREDCFHQLKTCIKDLLKQKLGIKIT